MGIVRHTDDSYEDLVTIWQYIANDNVDAADQFIERIELTLATLSDTPSMGRSRRELEDAMRSFPIGNYMIYYRPLEEGIEIVRVLSAKRDIRNQFDL